MTWAILGAVVAIVVVGVVVLNRGQVAGVTPREFPAWEAEAERLQLSFQEGDLVEPTRMAGDYKGRAVVLELTALPAAVLTVRTSTDTLLAEGLLLRREEGMAKLGKSAGLQDIQIGNQALDDLLRIEGLGDDHIVRLLTSPQVKGPLGRLFTRYEHAVVDRDHVAVHRRGVRSPPKDLEAILESVVSLANALDAANRDLTGSTLGLGAQPAPTLAPPTTLEAVPDTQDIYEPLDTADQTTSTLPQDESVADDGSAFDIEPETSPQPVNRALELLELLGDRSRTETEREDALEQTGPLMFHMVVDGTARSSGHLPESLKKGRTVQGHLRGHVLRKVAVRYPPDRNEEIEDLRPGGELVVDATPSGWDDFTRRLTFDAG